ncbi:MAG: phage holin family protein [Candidatus Latescibacterota bacterium]|nr:MAG: phage holin family protein [Candidatus Latescibacterota bacterium]
MNPLLDERAQAVGEEIRDYAKLHVDLARTEVRDGSTRFVWGLILVLCGAAMGALALVAGCASLYLFLHGRMSPPAATAVVTLVFASVAALSFRLAKGRLVGVRSLLLPRTRAMLSEALSWRNGKSNS